MSKTTHNLWILIGVDHDVAGVVILPKCLGSPSAEMPVCDERSHEELRNYVLLDTSSDLEYLLGEAVKAQRHLKEVSTNAQD